MIETPAHYTKMKDFPLTGEVTLNEYELYNLIEFIEIEFIESLRRDTDIDNCEYVMTIMTALQKMKQAYAEIERVRERDSCV